MKKPKSLRQERILTELNRAPSLRVAELGRRLDVSTETIRRDLDEMTEQGLLNRTYGGAVRSLSTEPSVTEWHALFVAERERIAKGAVQVLKGAQVLMIDSGSTTVHTARCVAVDMKNITVLTHSFGVATVLAINPTIKVVMLPGDYQAVEGATVGARSQPSWASRKRVAPCSLSIDAHRSVRPPSTVMISPVVKDAASLAR